MSEYERYKNWFRTALELDILILDHPTEKETLEGILDILAETCSTRRKEIRIAGDDKPREVVKGRLMKLDCLHIQYVLDCLKDNTSKVKNIKQYLLTTLFNAPVTISPYYQAIWTTIPIYSKCIFCFDIHHRTGLKQAFS